MVSRSTPYKGGPRNPTLLAVVCVSKLIGNHEALFKTDHMAPNVRSYSHRRKPCASRSFLFSNPVPPSTSSGKYGDQVGATACTDCGEATFTNGSGALFCEPVQPGYRVVFANETAACSSDCYGQTW